SCEKCVKFNNRRTKPSGKLHPITAPEGIFETIGVDFWGATPYPSAKGNRYVLVVTDYLSKYVIAKAMPYNTAAATAQFIHCRRCYTEIWCLAKRRYDKGRANPIYHPGDLVFIKRHGQRPKFGELYSGPYKVIQQ
ncbi:unnamed protein product, partial [Didymodactylos carnosus]